MENFPNNDTFGFRKIFNMEPEDPKKYFLRNLEYFAEHSGSA